MKVLFYIIWIVLVIVGSFTAPLIPETFCYLYGFFFGNASLIFYNLLKKLVIKYFKVFEKTQRPLLIFIKKYCIIYIES